jgi:hypothetical protein
VQIDSSNSRRAQPEGADSAYRVPVGAILLVMTIAGILSQLSVGLVEAWLMSAAAVALGAAAVLLRLPRNSDRLPQRRRGDGRFLLRQRPEGWPVHCRRVAQ